MGTPPLENTKFMGVSVGNYINGAQWDVSLHALCVGSGTTSPGVRDGLISDLVSTL